MKNKILTGVMLVIMLVTASGWVMSANENEKLNEVAQEQKDDINKKSTEIANLKDVIVKKDTDLESNKVVIKEQNTQIDKLKQDSSKIKEENSGLKSQKEQLQSELTIEKSKHTKTKEALKIEKAKKKVVKQASRVNPKVNKNSKTSEKTVSTAGVAKKKPETPKSGGRTISVSATSYVAMCDTGCTGITATGIDVRNSITYNGYRIIAVDPSVIPLGSIVSVSVGGQTFTAMALDTGGAIKGNKIDILVGSHSQAISAGRQQATVTIMK